jgi:hypothetical protein
MKIYEVIKPYTCKTYPVNIKLKIGDKVYLEGYLMGRDPVIKFMDQDRQFVIFEDFSKYFIEFKGDI